MRYFTDYIDYNENKSVCNIDSYYNEYDNLNRAFYGDTIYTIDNKVVNIERIEHFITGILMIKSKVKFGLNKRRRPIYLFKSLNPKYPDFKVSSSIAKKTKKNQYVYIKFTDWMYNSNYPEGHIVHIIGDVDNKNAMNDAILYMHNLKYKVYRESLILQRIYEDEITNKEHIISIDPIGCIDIDDAFSLTKSDDNYNLKIYIADNTFIINNDKLFNYMKAQTTSIYSPTKTYHLMPNMKYCSLIENEPKNANICEIIIKDNKITSYRFYQDKIIVNKNYSYDQVDVLLKTDKNLQTSRDIIMNLDFDYNSQNNDTIAHLMVEKLMILCNHLVFCELNKMKKPFIMRSHTKTINDIIVPDVIQTKYNNYLSNAAEYKVNNEECYHSGLDLIGYTHYTSPMRRFVDTINHLILFDEKEFTELELEEICDNCNLINKKCKRAHIQWKQLELLDQELKDNYTGFIVGFYNNKVKFYIPELDLFLSQKIIHYRLKEYYNTENTDNLFIVKREDKIVLTLKLFDKINIKIYKRPKEHYISKKLLFDISSITLIC